MTDRLLALARALAAALAFGGMAGELYAREEQPSAAPAAAAVPLPNGWKISPAGRTVRLLGDMPLRIVTAADGKSVFVVSGGYHDQVLSQVDPRAAAVRNQLFLGKAWAGLAVDPSGTVYVAGGGPSTKEVEADRAVAALPPELKAGLSQPVLRLTSSAGDLKALAGLSIAGLQEDTRFTAGLAVDAENLFVANIKNDTIYKLNTRSSATAGSVKVGYRPFQIALSPDRATLAVGNWGDKSVSLLDAASWVERVRVAVGTHPTDLAYGPDGRLFVANAGSNSVSVVSGNAVAETVVTSLHPGDLVGSTPDALAVSSDGKRLYVANADNNDIAVVDISAVGHARVMGFIPTAWYPSALAITADGKTLVAGIAKGIRSVPNVPAHLPRPQTTPDKEHPFDYLGDLLEGYAEIIPVPGSQQLEAYTRQVLANVPVADAGVTAEEQQEARAAFRKIQHVLYIIRENRTYDQVLGDDRRGDGDAELAIFGRKVTPNAHRLAELTPLLDHYFLNGEVSEDGHQWANAAYATAFNERATASSYGGRGEPASDERLTASPAGYLWDAARKKGLTYRSYGEFAHFLSNRNSPPVFDGSPGLEGHASAEFGVPPRDPERADVFIRELHEADKSGNWPNYMVMSLPEDHTSGLSAGQPTPKAAVASNDLALARIVEAVSHSRFWRSTAIFVTEDDAQDGPDHVDDHRSVGFVISPYAREGFIDHHHYTMMSMVRTIELILRLGPMSQYDGQATALYRLFQAKPREWTYTALPETEDLHALNPATGPLADASARLDFSDVDRADPQALNRILWAALRPGVPYPAPVRSAHLETLP
jgi:DNA-binding beta-propeller fold protein YncE